MKKYVKEVKRAFGWYFLEKRRASRAIERS
jgi:hypothetical protein